MQQHLINIVDIGEKMDIHQIDVLLSNVHQNGPPFATNQ